MSCARQRCDAYQWALLISTHEQRHVLQIREMKRSKSFSTSAAEIGWRDVNATTPPFASMVGAPLSSIHGPARSVLTAASGRSLNRR